MARSKSPFTIHTEYAAFSFVVGLVRRLPMRLAAYLVYGLMRLILGLMGRRRRLVLDNIQKCFPDWTPAQVLEVYRRSLRNGAWSAAHTVHMLDWTGAQRYDWIDMEHLEHLEEGLNRGKGVIAITAHYGCYEWMAKRVMSVYNGRVSLVYRALDNPKIDKVVEKWRTTDGGKAIERHALIRQGLKYLKNNEIIGILIDQNFPDGIFTTFFNRPAATVPIVSLLARRTGAAVVPVHNYWVGNRLKVVWEKPMTLSNNPDREQAVWEDTQAMTSIVEGWIRRDPSQWFWLHNRWKKQPTDTAPEPSAPR